MHHQNSDYKWTCTELDLTPLDAKVLIILTASALSIIWYNGLFTVCKFTVSKIPHSCIVYTLMDRLRSGLRSLSVCVQDYTKTHAWIWMKCCVLTDIKTWTNWLTFEPDPDHSPDAGTGLLSPIAYALQREILLCPENPYWARVATRGFESYALQCGTL